MIVSPLQLALSFLEGFGLILSPCILPVLPLILSTSIEGGRRRPYGIILGFIAAFAAFAFFSRWLVAALGIDLDLIKYGSLILLALFGLILMSETLSARFSAFTQGAANLGARFGGGAEGGFMSGLGIGALIGLVWTPCAGPFLAAILVQIVSQQTDWQSFILLSAFAIGVGVPMLLIALLGRRLVSKLGFFQRHAEGVRKTFGLLILLAVGFIAWGPGGLTLFQTDDSPNPKEAAMEETTGLIGGLRSPYPAPKIENIEEWFNSPPLTLDTLKGKVVLIDFWTYSCINCVRTLPYLKQWDEAYRDKGFVLIGIHAPEFEFEKNPANVRAAIAKYGIQYPVALDNAFSTWRNYTNRYWPAHYLIDRQGNVVYEHFGEGEYDRTEHNIRALLGLTDKPANAAEEAVPFSFGQTPETYLGAARGENFAYGDLRRGAEEAFSYPSSSLGLHEWALEGPWRIEGEKIVSTGPNAAIKLHFLARKVFLVMGPAEGKPLDLTLRLDGRAPGAQGGRDAPDGKVTVDRNTLYELIDLGKPGEGTLEIRSSAPGLEAYAFTFGS